jgi:hypothetical protein
MTKRDARKIATLRTARVLEEDDTLRTQEEIPLEDADKITKQQKEIADELAGRYGLDVGDIPHSTIRIVNGVLDGSL